MATQPQNKASLGSRLVRQSWWLLLVPALLAAHLGLVSTLLAIGSDQEVTLDDNAYLQLANSLNFNNPEVDAALARFLRARALLKGQDEWQEDLQQALVHWQTAQKERPLWPYYHVGALDVEYLLGSPAEVLQARINTLMTLAPNERGIDRNTLEIVILSWHKLTPDQQTWAVNRIASSNHNTRKYLYDFAVKNNLRNTLCTRLPWNQVKRLCR
ncbi:hypothetical protein [Thalassolituus oleivorans]|uniref:hypothetical protein n=1 Tax=Thalassolituus oleivorans TaxID=187493 RepID=UPI001CE2E380|nr:hypothetical protein [Thalassolituus oleivorans]MCA6129084.1 hypothetical protein [Thalassolituus oleivorans 4BN06-13]